MDTIEQRHQRNKETIAITKGIMSGGDVSVIRWNRTSSKVLVSYHNEYGQPVTRWLSRYEAIALSDGLMML